MTRPGWLVHAEHDAMDAWDGTRPDNDGRDETPDPPGDWPDDDALMQRFRETGAQIRRDPVAYIEAAGDDLGLFGIGELA